MMNTVAYSDRNQTATPTSISNPVFQMLVECFIDGAMILTNTGELVVSNNNASQICHQLTHQLTQKLSRVPQQIWRCCQTLIEDQLKSIEDEIKTDETGAIRIRAWWLESSLIDQPHLFVTLEDQHQSAEHRAKAEARKYRLTDRETQVWLLRRAGHSYKAIAAELHIAEDTVKKHIKSIHAKRDALEWLND
jgi:DNA-binding CsgD family transcriptional regulator